MSASLKKLWGNADRIYDLDHEFVETDDGLLHKNGDRLEEYTEPLKSARKSAEAAFEIGAVAFRRWPLKWGLSLGLSIPGVQTAWLVAHDYDTGKFVSGGVKFIEGIPFGDNMTVFEEQYMRAAEYILAYGVRKKTETLIRTTLKAPFFLTPKTIKLWGNDAKRYLGSPTIEALQALQNEQQVTPELAFKNSKTVEIVNEQYQQASYQSTGER